MNTDPEDPLELGYLLLRNQRRIDEVKELLLAWEKCEAVPLKEAHSLWLQADAIDDKLEAALDRVNRSVSLEKES